MLRRRLDLVAIFASVVSDLAIKYDSVSHSD